MMYRTVINMYTFLVLHAYSVPTLYYYNNIILYASSGIFMISGCPWQIGLLDDYNIRATTATPASASAAVEEKAEGFPSSKHKASDTPFDL